MLNTDTVQYLFSVVQYSDGEHDHGMRRYKHARRRCAQGAGCDATALVRTADDGERRYWFIAMNCYVQSHSHSHIELNTRRETE